MFIENLSIFLADFGEPVTVTRDDVPVAAFTAIFDNPDLQGQIGGIGCDARDRLLTCTEADAAAVERDDIITIRGETYYVAEKHPDGTGMVTLVLRLAPEE